LILFSGAPRIKKISTRAAEKPIHPPNPPFAGHLPFAISGDWRLSHLHLTIQRI